MLRPTIPGWKVETLGDDIAWIRPGEDGRLWAINPEAGFFGVAPGTGESTNVTAVETLWGNTIFTNVALRPDGDVWWEGLTDEAPANLIDWEATSGRPTPVDRQRTPTPGSRCPAAQCPQIADDWEEAVPLDVILFGGRRAPATSRSWSRPPTGRTVSSSARTSRRSARLRPRARSESCAATRSRCCPSADTTWPTTFGHWLKVGRGLRFDRAPRIFQVNWFRRGDDGRFLWPGFGDNSRVVDWIIRRIGGRRSSGRQPHTDACRVWKTSTSTGSTSPPPTSTSCSPSTPRRGRPRPT